MIQNRKCRGILWRDSAKSVLQLKMSKEEAPLGEEKPEKPDIMCWAGGEIGMLFY